MPRTRNPKPTDGKATNETIAIAIPTAVDAKPPRKREIVNALLGRPEGASTAELAAATGWQPHTVRAALSMRRKEGEVITRTGRGETMRYHLGEAR